MKSRVLLLFLMFTLTVAKAQTIEVEGGQSGVWDADTVKVMGDVKVVGSLEVLPGTTVLFDRFYGITVADGAEFLALGSADDSIVFTVADTLGFHDEYAFRGGWNGFKVVNGRVRLDYCVLEYGKAVAHSDAEGGAMNVNGGDITINHSVLRHNTSCNRGGAIHAVNADVKMSSCCVNYNAVDTKEPVFAMYGGGLSFLKCHVDLYDMEFRGNYGPSCIGGALSLDSCMVSLRNAVFADNVGINGGGMYMMRNNGMVNTLYNLAFYNNFSGHFAGGMALANSSPYVYNLLVVNNVSAGVNCGGMFIYEHSSPKFYNCIFHGNAPVQDSMLADSVQMWLWVYDDFGPEFHNCLIQGGRRLITSDENIKVFDEIIDADPMFVDVANEDFRLQEGSPCRDAGFEFVPYDLAGGNDLGGLRRVSNGRIDIGPYEYSAAGVSQYGDGAAFAHLTGNPLRSESCLMADLSRPQQVTVRVCSATGHTVVETAFDGQAGLQRWRLGDAVAKLAPGLYVIEVITDEGVCAIKTVK